MDRSTPPLKVEVSHTLSKEQLDSISSQVIQTTLEALEEAKRTVGIKQLLNKKEACRFLDCSPQQLELFISKGLKYHRVGERTYYFDRDEIMAFIKQF
ncbi:MULTISPECIES: helix-turn-helix transcriptional regulator [Enterococcus]|uniref:Helix-turn-helix domain-containing protein n=1 Tax=Enterococcus xiangfangensis TaxID=1296537 RepID=A0ABU3FBL1_9ENTE|nr:MULTISPECIES: helix-turn-helix domain-containing protein [Enterococcus]MDT2759850.1 helix-turn-helix domain-containing protein [Enterococcus xiangfangensis]